MRDKLLKMNHTNIQNTIYEHRQFKPSVFLAVRCGNFNANLSQRSRHAPNLILKTLPKEGFNALQNTWPDFDYSFP